MANEIVALKNQIFPLQPRTPNAEISDAAIAKIASLTAEAEKIGRERTSPIAQAMNKMVDEIIAERRRGADAVDDKKDMLAAMMDGARAGKFQPVAHPVGSVRLHAPIADPGKFICIGLNYKDHAAEMKKKLPEEPLVFLKPSTTVIGPEDAIRIPTWAGRIEHDEIQSGHDGTTGRIVARPRTIDETTGTEHAIASANTFGNPSPQDELRHSTSRAA